MQITTSGRKTKANYYMSFYFSDHTPNVDYRVETNKGEITLCRKRTWSTDQEEVTTEGIGTNSVPVDILNKVAIWWGAVLPEEKDKYNIPFPYAIGQTVVFSEDKPTEQPKYEVKLVAENGRYTVMMPDFPGQIISNVHHWALIPIN